MDFLGITRGTLNKHGALGSICVLRATLGKTVTERCSVSGRKKARLMQYYSSYSNYLKKQRLVKTVKSCREVKIRRKGLLELEIRNAVVIFTHAVSGVWG